MQKYANLVELEKCSQTESQTHIFLQNFVLIQPRTSPLKICKNLQKFAKFANFADPNAKPLTVRAPGAWSGGAAAAPRGRRPRRRFPARPGGSGPWLRSEVNNFEK